MEQQQKMLIVSRYTPEIGSIQTGIPSPKEERRVSLQPVATAKKREEFDSIANGIQMISEKQPLPNILEGDRQFPKPPVYQPPSSNELVSGRNALKPPPPPLPKVEVQQTASKRVPTQKELQDAISRLKGIDITAPQENDIFEDIPEGNDVFADIPLKPSESGYQFPLIPPSPIIGRTIFQLTNDELLKYIDFEGKTDPKSLNAFRSRNKDRDASEYIVGYNKKQQKKREKGTR